MENITYYYASNENAENLNGIISDPLFQEVVDYFLEREEQEIILRNIKVDIPTDSNLELYLDKLIKYNLLERKNRRYSLTFPIYLKEKPLKIPDSIILLLKTIVQESSAMTNYFIFGEWLWSLFFDVEQENYFFGVKDSPIFLSRREAGNDKLSFVSVFPDNLIPLDLANYFYFLSRRRELPKQFEPLHYLIGDVDINYFIPQIQKVIRAVDRNKLRERQKNIFQEALLITEDLKRNKDDQLFLSVPFFDEYKLSVELQIKLDQLKAELLLLWASIEDNNQRVFFKKQLYSYLFNNCLSEKESISYFKL